MQDWEGVIYLKNKSLPKHLQQSISNLSDVSTIFSLLDTQFGDKYVEVAKIKQHIIGDAPLTDPLDFNKRLTRVKFILKYLTIFRKHFNYIEKLRISEVSQSLMTWLPNSVYTNELYFYLKEISDQYSQNIPVADSYYAVLIRASGTLTALQADYNNFTIAQQIPSLNIQTQPPSSMPEKQITQITQITQPQKHKQNITCVLCGDSHLTHKCLLTRKI